MNDTQTLEKLRSLRLYGMAEAFAVLLQLGPTDKRTPEEVLAELTDAEWDSRQNRRSARLLKAARLRYQATFEEITYSPERNLDRKAVRALGSQEWIQRGATVLVTGATGVGKSFLACAIGQQACLTGIATRYEQAPKFFPRLRQARGDGTYRREIERLARTPLFILDDFGLIALDDNDRVSLLEILEDRYGRTATVIASQLPVAKWHACIGQPTIADAIMDRLAHTPFIFELKGGSMRKAAKAL
ncbi:MAG TPA: IS21-like element helper ATPase IstB [Spirochaetia bacterium]|nr:IS21-like element helper ATPase IstB [Spirochaetia bacterium]